MAVHGLRRLRSADELLRVGLTTNTVEKTTNTVEKQKEAPRPERLLLGDPYGIRTRAATLKGS